MRNRFTIGLLAIIAICSCQKQELDYQVYDSKTFTATIENTSDTKTSLDNDGNVLWKKDDQLSIFGGSTINQQYKVQDASDGKTVAALEAVSPSGFVAGSEIDNNVAFYPYSKTATITKKEPVYYISDISLPSTQNYAVNSFGNGAFPMVAVTNSTSDMNLKFKNILGGLKLQLKGIATIKSISVKGNNNEILCGAAEVTASNGTVPSISLIDESSKIVTLDCGEGASLNIETVTSFIIALPPITMSAGFTVTIIDTQKGQMEIKTTNSQSIIRSNILKMPEVTYKCKSDNPYKMEAVDLGLSVKWASCNIGASKPEEYGRYFAWGDVVGQTWILSTWYGSGFSIYPEFDVDDKNNLKPEYDAAHVKLGGTWRMPTHAEQQELVDNCTMTTTTDYAGTGVAGSVFTSKKVGYTDKSIFLPATGLGYKTGRLFVGSDGYYWSSSFYGDGSAWYLYFTLGDVYTDHIYRYLGQPVRAVSE